MPRIVISARSSSKSSPGPASSVSSPVGSTRGSLRIRDNKTDLALSAAGRALGLLDQLSDLIPSVPGLGLATSAARTLINEAKSARRRRRDCEDLAEYASQCLQDVSRRLVDREEWPPQLEEKMRELARVFIETSTRVREIGSANVWRTLIMRDSYDAMMESQRAELANAFHTFNVVVNLDTNIVVRETQKDVKALLLNRDRDELGYLKIQFQDIRHVEANSVCRMGWFSGTTNVQLVGVEGVILCKEYLDLQKWRDDLILLKKLRHARLPELLAYSAQADASQLYILMKPVPHLDIQQWTINTLSERTIVENVHLYYHGLRTLRDAAKHVQTQLGLTDEQLVGNLCYLQNSDLVVDGDDTFLLALPNIDKTVCARCRWFSHWPGCLGNDHFDLCYPDPCGQFKSMLHSMIRICIVVFSETGNMTHENRYMTRQRQFYDLIGTLSLTLWEKISFSPSYESSFQHLVQSYMTKRASNLSLRELRRLSALGGMSWYQTEFTNVGSDNDITHLAAGTYGWIPPHNPLHPDVRDMSKFVPLGHLREVIPELLTTWQRTPDVAILLSPWGNSYKVGLQEWRRSRPSRFHITVTARHKESVDLSFRENNFWRFLAEQGVPLADKHRHKHPLIEAHDPIIVCCVESEFKSSLDVDLTDPQWSLVASDCHFKPILDFLERAALEVPPSPYLSGLTTVVLGQLCGHTEASGFSGSIAWHEDPEAQINGYTDCDCVLVPKDVNLAPPPPETKLDCQCDFCRQSASKWTMEKTWVAKLDKEDFRKPS